MSESKEINIHSLYAIVLREIENKNVQEIPPNFYSSISDFIGKLKREEYDGVEGKVKNTLVSTIAELTSLFLTTRLEKISSLKSIEYSNLLDVEKFVIDAEEEIRERKEMIISATLNGKSKLLDSISGKHKTKSVVVRFLKGMDQIVGVDLEKYGPFKTEDVANIPYENAQALISKKLAVKVRLED